MEFHSKKYQVNGIEMNVIIEGKGEPVLLLHGFPDTHDIWRLQIPALVQAGYQVIAPDTRGCGRTEVSMDVKSYHINNLVKDVIALLDVLKLDKVKLVGHDWGAVQGWGCVLQHPERFERYMALSVGHPSCYATGGVMQKLKGWYIGVFQLRGFAEWFFTARNWAIWEAFTDCPAEIQNWRTALNVPGRLTAGMSYYRANLGLIVPGNRGDCKVPVYGVFSTKDIALVEGQMTRSEQYCKAGWQYTRLDGVGHWMTTEAPQLVTPLILSYLQQPLAKA